MRHSIAVAVCLFLSLCTFALAQVPAPRQSCPSCCQCCADCCCHGDFWTRDKLTGDWLGCRPCLAQHGIIIDSSLTQFYQGVASGGAEQTSRYGNKFDLYLAADTGRLGLWQGGKLQIHGVDWNFGENSIADGVGLAPVNTNLLTPRIEPTFALTTLLYEQQIGHGFAAMIGRISILDLWSVLYPDYGRGVDGFMNMSFNLPMNGATCLPVIQNLAGIIKAGKKGIQGGIVVIESQNVPVTSGLDFPNGSVLVGLARYNSTFCCLPGSHTVIAAYATGDYTSFNASDWIVIPGGGVIPAEQSGTWMVTYIAEQRLWVDGCNPKRYTKVHGKVGVSDADTSPFSVTGSIAWEAFGMMDCRPHDRMGVGYFYSGLNGAFKDLFLLSGNTLDDLHGCELYYNAAITPWFHLTADLQVIDPAQQANDTAIVLALRAKLDF
jgi:porin